MFLDRVQSADGCMQQVLFLFPSPFVTRARVAAKGCLKGLSSSEFVLRPWSGGREDKRQKVPKSKFQLVQSPKTTEKKQRVTNTIEKKQRMTNTANP